MLNFKVKDFYISMNRWFNRDKKFIYTFSEEEYKRLLKDGFPYINKVNFGKKVAYIFLNDNVSKVMNFSEDRKKELFFTNDMYF